MDPQLELLRDSMKDVQGEIEAAHRGLGAAVNEVGAGSAIWGWLQVFLLALILWRVW
jgi:hypothetical protein